MLKKLSVRARGTALVQDYRAMDAGVRRYIGRTVDHSTVNEETDVGMAFKPTGKAEEVSTHLTEYKRHVQHGDLWPADEATAKHCEVAFDATFGATAKEETSEPGADASEKG